MEIEEFLKKLRGTKRSCVHTGYYEVKVKTNKERTMQTLYRIKKCVSCGHEDFQQVRVIFKEPWHLTIFEADLLFAVFALKQKPMDYANYHQCEAGKKFIQNISGIVT